jgi:integrase
MADIVNFAIYSCRRQAEITRLQWADNDAAHHTGIVRDAKHPRMKMGNHREFKYTPEAWAIVERQPKRPDSEFIFPYDPKSIGAAFLTACKACGISDLRFHDLRHHGVSLLFEKGYSIVEVQQFSLHESWATLQRYTHLSPKNVIHR